MSHGKFATAINCIDGRTHDPVRDWAKRELGVDFVDMPTRPGVDDYIANNAAEALLDLQEAVGISVNGHGSRNVIVVGHHDCAGNPVSKEVHFLHIRKSCDIVASWELPIRVIGLWVGDKWEIEKIYDTKE